MTFRLLIVDADADIELAGVVSPPLAAAGHDLEVVHSFAEALERYESAPPDLVVCDLGLTHGGSVDPVADLSAAHPEIPVIVVSGSHQMKDVIQALRVGAIDFVQRPVEGEILVRAVDRSLERIRLIRENRDYAKQLEDANRRLEGNLRAFERDERAGLRVQTSMLPPSPMRVGDYRLCHMIHPSLVLSGDFVDYFEVTDRHFCFYIADVAGHGASSAFITVLLKNFSRRLRREYSARMLARPGLVLSWVNRELLDNQLEKHVTLFIGIVNRKTRVLHFANAGHFPYPLLRRDGNVVPLEITGKPLGLFPDLEYENGSVELGEKSTIIAFTDGVLEVMQDDSLADKEARLVSIARDSASDPDAVSRHLGLNRDEPAPDDIAMLVVTSE